MAQMVPSYTWALLALYWCAFQRTAHHAQIKRGKFTGAFICMRPLSYFYYIYYLFYLFYIFYNFLKSSGYSGQLAETLMNKGVQLPRYLGHTWAIWATNFHPMQLVLRYSAQSLHGLSRVMGDGNPVFCGNSPFVVP